MLVGGFAFAVVELVLVEDLFDVLDSKDGRSPPLVALRKE